MAQHQAVRLGTGAAVSFVAQGDAPECRLRSCPGGSPLSLRGRPSFADEVDRLGCRDALLSGDDQERLAADIAGSRLIVYPETGHLVLWEEPERVAGDLTDLVG